MYKNIFTTNENTTDGEVLDGVYDLISRTDLTNDEKVRFITLSLEYAREND